MDHGLGDPNDSSHEDHASDELDDEDIGTLLSAVLELESDLDRSLGRIEGDEEIEKCFEFLNLWVAEIAFGTSSLQSNFPVREYASVVGAILDVTGRRERAQSRHDDAIADIIAARDAGRITEEGANSLLERMAGTGPVDFIPNDLPSEEEILRRKLVLHLAWHRVRELLGVAERSIALAPFVMGIRLPEIVNQYLARVAANFVEGRHTEGVILARAVLDAVLKERLTDAEVLACSPKIKRESDVALWHRISAAEHLGRLSRDSVSLAHGIRIKGNDAVHVNGPPVDGFLGDFHYVRALAAVLEELYSDAAS